MFCKNCGEKLNEDSVFCFKCGFNQKENQENSKKVNQGRTISWYELDSTKKESLKSEFKSLYPSSIGSEILVVIFYVLGAIATLFCFGRYTISYLNSTVTSGTYISMPALLIAIAFFTIGTIVGFASNSKFDKAFTNWLITAKNIRK